MTHKRLSFIIFIINNNSIQLNGRWKAADRHFPYHFKSFEANSRENCTKVFNMLEVVNGNQPLSPIDEICDKLKLTSMTLDLEMPMFSINVKIFLLRPLLLLC